MSDKIMNLVKIDKVEKAAAIHFNPFAIESALIDSLYADPDLRDICKARMFCQQMYNPQNEMFRKNKTKRSVS